MERIRAYALPAATLLAGIAIAGGLLFGSRFETKQAANVLWRTDRLTGSVTACWYHTEYGGPAGCERLLPNQWEVAGRRHQSATEASALAADPYADLGKKK